MPTPCRVAEACEKLFDHLDTFTDNTKKKATVWPLQMMLLILCPVRILLNWLLLFFRQKCICGSTRKCNFPFTMFRCFFFCCINCYRVYFTRCLMKVIDILQPILEEIVNADQGAPCSQKYLKKVICLCSIFIDMVCRSFELFLLYH